MRAAVLAAVIVLGCGPNRDEVRFAKAMAYRFEPTDMLDHAKTALAAEYDIKDEHRDLCKELWKDCAVDLTAVPKGGSDAYIVSVHRNAEHQSMIEVSVAGRPGTDDDDLPAAQRKQVEHITYVIYSKNEEFVVGKRR